MAELLQIKSNRHRDKLASAAIVARKMAEQRARKGKKTFDPLHKELSKVLFRPTKKYQKNQPLIGKVEIINPAEIFKKSIVKTSAPIKGLSRANPDVLSRDLRAKKQNIESQRKYEALFSPSSKDKSHLDVSQAAPGRTRRNPNIGGKKKYRRTQKKRKRRRTQKKRKRQKTQKKRKRRRRRSHQK